MGEDGGYSEMHNLQARGDAAGQDHRHPGAERDDAGDPERPGGVCENCGEAYVDEATARELLHGAEAAARAGVMVDIREYAVIAGK